MHLPFGRCFFFVLTLCQQIDNKNSSIFQFTMFTPIIFGLCFWIMYLIFQLGITLISFVFNIIGGIFGIFFDWDDPE